MACGLAASFCSRSTWFMQHHQPPATFLPDIPLNRVCPSLLRAGCDFSNQDLSGKVFSGVLLQGANLSNTKVVGSQFARAQAQGAILVNTDFTDTNLYGT